MRQRLGHARPALRPVRVTGRMVPLVTALLHPLRGPSWRLVRRLLRYVWVSDGSGPCLTGVERYASRCGPPGPRVASPELAQCPRQERACMLGGDVAQRPRPTRVHVCLDGAFHPPTRVGALDEQLSWPNTPPTCPPTAFSSASDGDLRTGSGPMWSLHLYRRGRSPPAPCQSPGKSGRSVTPRGRMVFARVITPPPVPALPLSRAARASWPSTGTS